MCSADFATRLDQLLSEALARHGAARERFVRTVARDEPRIAQELEALLRHAGDAETFLSLQACESRDRLLARAIKLDVTPAGPLNRKDQVLGSFRVDQEIARTRRSAVYLASRIDEEWDQQVAIKVLTRGVDSDDVLRRFLAERQILSVLHNPNIATLLDGGITPDGLPYFVMEYIDGDPVTEHCKAKRLSLKARLRICREVCSAVAFAHRHLVVHRDLKPSNILVTRDGQVKLLDFGIAKLLAPEIDPAISPHTIEMARPMTPRYASPEQLSGGAISSSTDVYQLGLLFTELLTGTQDAKSALGISADSGPDVKPSRVTRADAEDPPYARRELRGDLDWILLKALETQPECRYSSAAELATDLENYQNSRAVSARKATAAYLLRKFLRRRPVLSATLALTFLGGLAFIGILSDFNRQLDAERQSALEAAARAQEVKDLLVGFIRSPDPYSGSGADARVSEVLLNSEAVVADELASRPRLQRELYGTLADVYQNLAMHERSVTMRLEALRLRQPADRGDPFEALQERRKLAQSQMALGRTQEAVAELETVRSELAEHFEERLHERAIVEREIGNFHTAYGRSTDALSYLENSVRLAERHGQAPILLAESLHALALALEQLRRFSASYDLLLRSHRLYVDNLGPEHTRTLLEQAQIAAAVTNLGRYEESIAIYDAIRPELERQLGPMHVQVLELLNNLAFTHIFADNLERSVELHYEVLRRRRQKFGDTHRDVADSLQNAGAVLTRLQRYDESIETLREAARIYHAVNQPGQPLTAYPHVSLAIVYAAIGSPKQAEQEALEALGLLEGNVPDSHPALLRSQCVLGEAWIRQGKLEEGLALLERSVTGLTGQSDLFTSHLKACRDALSWAQSLNTQASP